MDHNRRFFLDTNCILDVLLDRSPFADPMKELFSLIPTTQLYISALTIHISCYVLNPAPDDYQTLSEFFDMFQIIDLTKESIEFAFASRWNDLEDSMQWQCALNAGCSVLVTRDSKGFKQAEGLDVVSPTAVLASL